MNRPPTTILESLLIVFLLALPLASHASVIQYDYNGTGAGWTITGQVQIDSTNLAASVNMVPFFTSWGMSWTNGTTTFATDSTLEGIWAASYFTLDSALNVLSSDICSGPCLVSSHPEARLRTTTWFATVSSSAAGVSGPGTWSLHSTVPEPGTLALLSLGLFGLGFNRRRIQG